MTTPLAPLPTKHAITDHPILELLAGPWSPYGFSDRPVSDPDLHSLFEAARWAPSSYNEQPWSYLVATRDDPREFARLLSCLEPANQAWAKSAPVLALGVVSLRFARNNQENRAAMHDLGMASDSPTSATGGGQKRKWLIHGPGTAKVGTTRAGAPGRSWEGVGRAACGRVGRAAGRCRGRARCGGAGAVRGRRWWGCRCRRPRYVSGC